MCSSAPDTSGLNNAAVQSAQISQDALNWFKQAYADQAPDRAATTALDRQVSQAQIGAMDFATQQAKEASDRNKTVFQPLENQLVQGAQQYDTPERRAQAAAEATADVEKSFASSQDALKRSMMRMGVTPGSGRSMALMQDAALEKAKAEAGATTTAVKNVEQQGYARMMDAASLGRNLPSNQATQQQIATGSGSAATGAAGSALSAAMSGNATMGQGFNTGLAGMGQAGQLYGQIAGIQNQANQANNGLFGALGNVAGAYAGSSAGSAAITSLLGIGSDENIKKKTGKKANTAKMLRGVEKTQVDEGWEYDPKKGGPDDGQKHDGPMAQSVRKNMGEKAAPGGKVIDLLTMNAHLMGSVQELSKQVKDIKRQLPKMAKEAA